jgi:hypothetical protein
MKLSELWLLYEADKRILGFSQHTLKAYSLQLQMLLNIEDINFENCSSIVNGKGSKQREVYFTTECKVWLKRYLNRRKDSFKALFLTQCYPTRGMAIPTIR